MKSSLTIDNVKSYLAQKGPDDIVGSASATCHCLAAETLAWMYPGCGPIVNEPENLSAYIHVGGEEVTVEFEPEVTAVATKFDKKGLLASVTKRELMRDMPELFEP